MGPRRYERQKLDPHRDGEPELEPIAMRKLRREELSVHKRTKHRIKNVRAISTGQLHTLRCFHLRPINVVVYHDPSLLRVRDLILESVSRLYAFSVYLVRT